MLMVDFEGKMFIYNFKSKASTRLLKGQKNLSNILDCTVREEKIFALLGANNVLICEEKT